ncbi:MAG: hypothetical protein LBI87_05815 [Candidatus Accumulibacter sp.]|nr:hypothetical protein [Accumulibacter sp.]
MLLTITHAGRNTPDIGFLFRKNPARPRVFNPSHGRACVFIRESRSKR